MALVDYSSSTSSDEGSTEHTVEAEESRKRKRPSPSPEAQPSTATRTSKLPTLPSSFHDTYASSTRTTTHDDPSLHGGRKRAIPHVQGNWPSHVYLEWLPSLAEHATLTELLSAVQKQSPEVRLETLLMSSLETPLPLHISLSAPLSIPSDKKDAFADQLHQMLPLVGHLEVKLSDLDWVSNMEGTRWFLVLRCEHPGLGKLLAWSNRVCRHFGFEQLYVGTQVKQSPSKEERERRKLSDAEAGCDSATPNDRFHFSIAWCLNEPQHRNDLQESKIVVEKLRQVKTSTVSIHTVKVKIGNVVTSLDLHSRRHEEGSILS